MEAFFGIVAGSAFVRQGNNIVPRARDTGVVTGDNLIKLMEHARANGYAIPAVNVSSSSTANACLEAAKKANSPIIVQVSQGGGAFVGGKCLHATAVSPRTGHETL